MIRKGLVLFLKKTENPILTRVYGDFQPVYRSVLSRVPVGAIPCQVFSGSGAAPGFRLASC